MPFDAEATVNASERFMRVRNLIADLPPERFDYGDAWPHGVMSSETAPIPIHECGTNHCILGWSRALYGHMGFVEMGKHLGVGEDQMATLCYFGKNPTHAQALRTMDHLALTGVVDWTIGMPTTD